MSDIPKDDDGGGASSPKDAEQSVRHTMSIIHPPIPRSSPPSPGQRRKQAKLEERAAHLKRRNADVKEKVREVRKRQESIDSMASAHMIAQFVQVNERRQRHLDQIRERARTLRSYLLSPRSKSQTGAHTMDHGPGLLFSREQIEISTDDNSDLEDFQLYSESEQRSLRTIQHAVRQRLLRSALADADLSRIVDGVLDFSFSYEESVDLVTTRAGEPLCNLLAALGLPTTGKGYQWFMYSVVLISEFHDSTDIDYFSQPGYNVHVRGSEGNPLSTHLPIILYRSAIRIFCQLQKMLRLPLASIMLQIATPRLVLARYWRQYHFYFLLYKLNHRRALRSIADHAFDIASTHERILKSLEGQSRRDFRLRAREFERYSRLLLMTTPADDVSWATIGVDREVFCNEVKGLAKSPKSTEERLATEVQHSPHQLADDYHRHRVTGVGLFTGAEEYFIPPTVRTSKWRQFFFNMYSEDLAKLSQSRCPMVLRTGFRSGKKSSSNFQLNEVVEMMNPGFKPQFVHQSDPHFYSWCDGKLRDLFNQYYSYCKFTRGREDLKGTIDNFDELSSLYNLNEVETVDVGQFRTYLKLFMLLLMQLLLFASVDTGATLSFVMDIEDDTEEILFKFNCLYNDLESALCTKWASYCLLRSVESFARFENMYQAAVSKGYRGALRAHFPQHRFALFYQFVYRNSGSKSDAHQFVISSICGVQSEPDFDKEVVREDALEFFTKVLVNYLTGDMQLPTCEKLRRNKLFDIELFSLFHEELTHLSTRAQKLFVLSYLSSMLNLNCKQSESLLKVIDRSDSILAIGHHIDVLQPSLSEFQWKFLSKLVIEISGSWPLLQIFHQKLRDACLDFENSPKLILGNFPHLASNWMQLHEQMVGCCRKFYMLYYPILNWIYADMGCPQFAQERS